MQCVSECGRGVGGRGARLVQPEDMEDLFALGVDALGALEPHRQQHLAVHVQLVRAARLAVVPGRVARCASGPGLSSPT